MTRPTITDIAKEAGVSLATVDRVLNLRPGVRKVTSERVNQAIERLGYIRDVSAANLARQRTYRLVFIVPEGQGQFMLALHETIADCAASVSAERTGLSILSVPMKDPQAMVRTLRSLDASELDGVALMAPETPQVRDAVLRLKKAGVAIVALVSDLPSACRDHFVGINNLAAGKTAGVLMGRFLGNGKGQIIVLANSMLSRDSIDRRLGFDCVMLERFPDLTVLPSLEGHDDDEKMACLLTTTFAKHHDIRGIYTLGTGNRAVTQFLLDAPRVHKPVVVAHELTTHTRGALQEGVFDAVITQNLGHIVRSAVRVLRARSDQMTINSSQEKIRLEIVLKENLPD